MNHVPVGTRVVVMEDNAVLAEELCEMIEVWGGTVVGPFASEDEALTALDRETIDVAAVDINLGGKPAFGVADKLLTLGVAIVFVSGYTRDFLPARFDDMPLVEKPVDVDRLHAEIAEAAQHAIARRRASLHALKG